jgi:hypothetical protein
MTRGSPAVTPSAWPSLAASSSSAGAAVGAAADRRPHAEVLKLDLPAVAEAPLKLAFRIRLGWW